MKVIKCDRCRKRCRNDEGWNAVYEDGFVIGYLCPKCQTSEESLEAQVNDATLDYSKTFIDELGRHVSPVRMG
ncbi:hypothetical protein H483_0118070 [Dietzia sp. UCD-THP]|nr:hypothetical protein H483_0118070 [Dietzia sp. UCD-THP]